MVGGEACSDGVSDREVTREPDVDMVVWKERGEQDKLGEGDAVCSPTEESRDVA